MKKILLIGILTIALVTLANAQIYLNPNYGSKSLKEVKITKIQITSQYTIIDFYFNSGNAYPSGGWIALSKNMYIKNATTHEKYYLIKASNIPILPERLDFKGKYTRKFKAYFPSINPTTKMIHIIEEATNGFNFYEIPLRPMA